ncbi:MAG: polyamine aminopropyltransferase [Armatimonadetes bacterium]|nr:polyamine aminopropyltransferase [Armatimonadota bacterium]
MNQAEEELPDTPSAAARREAPALLTSIFLIAACGLVYELLIATVSSYLLGSSVTQFSVAIGVFIGAMGLGSQLSQSVRRGLLGAFILIEIALGILGGSSVGLLFWAYASGAFYWIALYTVLIAIGTLTGLELPLLTRLLKRYGSLRTVIAQALSFDYVGALTGSLLFPLLLLPALGMARTAFLIGLLNIGVAVWNIGIFRSRLKMPGALLAICAACAVLLGAGLAFATPLVGLLERRLYEDEIIYSAQTPYQRIIVTRWRDDIRLYLDGNLQFSSTDEYRYHESLVHPALSLSPAAEEVLILGGGDGLAVREVLKYPQVKRITLVDIDPQMTDLGKRFPAFAALNRNALDDPRLRLVHRDACKFLEEDSGLYDIILADLPDPNTDVLAKLYSVEFYKLVKRHLSAPGVFVTQATSPFFARKAYWCIAQTVAEVGLHVLPYHAYVPSFGDWGWVMAARHALRPERIRLAVPVRFLTPESLQGMFAFGKDVDKVGVAISTLDRPAIMTYYLKDWKQWD